MKKKKTLIIIDGNNPSYYIVNEKQVFHSIACFYTAHSSVQLFTKLRSRCTLHMCICPFCILSGHSEKFLVHAQIGLSHKTHHYTSRDKINEQSADKSKKRKKSHFNSRVQKYFNINMIFSKSKLKKPTPVLRLTNFNYLIKQII